MKKWIVLDAIALFLFGVVALAFSPDVFSLVIISVMCVVVALGYGRGIMSALNFADGFNMGSNYLEQIKGVNSESSWLTFQQVEKIFHNRVLDTIFMEYRTIVNAEQKEDTINTDIESMVNEDILALHSWQSVVLQIPGTLTALGLIGTFLGLILGISGIAFSSVEAAISSITLLLEGIKTAFYTSIIGVIYSMLFNLSYRLAWNTMLRELGMFLDRFHRFIIPSHEMQLQKKREGDMEHILECLERIPKGSDYLMTNDVVHPGREVNEGSERYLMSEIWEGLKNEDFLFFIQPQYDLNSRMIVGGEALMRWNHSRLGIVSPSVFLPILEKNGYIVKLDCYIWEDVCKTIRKWLDMDLRPVPISINISRIDILAMNVADYFREMMKKYDLTPQSLCFEIANNAYSQSREAVCECENALRSMGFRVVIDGYKGDYSMIGSIQDSHADALKLDMQSLDDKKNSDVEFIGKIFEQTRKAHVKVIAAGIENMRQLNMLRKAGCTEGQGYFLYKPVSVDAFENMLRNIE